MSEAILQDGLSREKGPPSPIAMTRRQKHPLRALSAEERQNLERIARATRESATRVARAKALLAVCQGHSYTSAAQASGRRSGDAVAQLGERFNQEG